MPKVRSAAGAAPAAKANVSSSVIREATCDGTAGRLRRRQRSRGQSLIETAFLVPWLFFLFVGALDLGFYMYALICVESAARQAAIYTSSSSTTETDSAGACTIALAELYNLPNVGAIATCSALPVEVVVTSASDGYDGTYSSVAVTYQTIVLIPIPGILPDRFTFTRVVQMVVKS